MNVVDSDMARWRRDTEYHARLKPLVDIARFIHEIRLSANALLGAKILSDPKFEMLLELFIAHGEQRLVSVTEVCNAADVPQTSGLRHMDTLEKAGFLTRARDPDDRRRWWVHASPKAIGDIANLMTKYKNAR